MRSVGGGSAFRGRSRAVASGSRGAASRVARAKEKGRFVSGAGDRAAPLAASAMRFARNSPFSAESLPKQGTRVTLWTDCGPKSRDPETALLHRGHDQEASGRGED